MYNYFYSIINQLNNKDLLNRFDGILYHFKFIIFKSIKYGVAFSQNHIFLLEASISTLTSVEDLVAKLQAKNGKCPMLLYYDIRLDMCVLMVVPKKCTSISSRLGLAQHNFANIDLLHSIDGYFKDCMV